MVSSKWFRWMVSVVCMAVFVMGISVVSPVDTVKVGPVAVSVTSVAFAEGDEVSEAGVKKHMGADGVMVGEKYNLGHTGVLAGLEDMFNKVAVSGVARLYPHITLLIMLFGVISWCTNWSLYEGQMRLSMIIGTIMKICFFWWLATWWVEIADDIFNSLVNIGLYAAGDPGVNGTDLTKNLTSTTIIDNGFKTVDNIWENANTQGVINGLVKLIGMLMVLLAHFFLAFEVFVTRIEFRIFEVLSFVFLPFGIFGPTSFLFQRCVSGVFAYGARLMVITFILGMVQYHVSWGNAAAVGLTKDSGGTEYMVVGLSMLMLAYLTMKAGQIAQSLASGSPSMSGGGVMGAASSVVGSVARGGAMLAGAAALAKHRVGQRETSSDHVGEGAGASDSGGSSNPVADAAGAGNIESLGDYLRGGGALAPAAGGGSGGGGGSIALATDPGASRGIDGSPGGGGSVAKSVVANKPTDLKSSGTVTSSDAGKANAVENAAGMDSLSGKPAAASGFVGGQRDHLPGQMSQETMDKMNEATAEMAAETSAAMAAGQMAQGAVNMMTPAQQSDAEYSDMKKKEAEKKAEQARYDVVQAQQQKQAVASQSQTVIGAESSASAVSSGSGEGRYNFARDGFNANQNAAIEAMVRNSYAAQGITPTDAQVAKGVQQVKDQLVAEDQTKLVQGDNSATAAVAGMLGLSAAQQTYARAGGSVVDAKAAGQAKLAQDKAYAEKEAANTYAPGYFTNKVNGMKESYAGAKEALGDHFDRQYEASGLAATAEKIVGKKIEGSDQRVGGIVNNVGEKLTEARQAIDRPALASMDRMAENIGRVADSNLSGKERVAAAGSAAANLAAAGAHGVSRVANSKGAQFAKEFAKVLGTAALMRNPLARTYYGTMNQFRNDHIKSAQFKDGSLYDFDSKEGWKNMNN